jgi:hypothetical protein
VSDLCVILDSGLQEDQIAIICREALKVRLWGHVHFCLLSGV